MFVCLYVFVFVFVWDIPGTFCVHVVSCVCIVCIVCIVWFMGWGQSRWR